MVWYENWLGKDWMGRKVPPLADHVEGMYNEQEKEPVVEKMKIVGYQRLGTNTVYYVPFSNSKVDEIINSSVGSYRDNIVYCVKNGSEMRNDKFSYEQFVSLKFEDCVDLEPIPKLSSYKLLCCLLIGQDQDSFYPSFHTL